MNALEEWVLAYLLNSLWQVPLLFAAAWVVSRMVRRVGPRAEHRVWVSALMLEAALPACSWRINELLQQAWELLHAGAHTANGAVRVTVGSGSATSVGMLRLPATVMVGIAIAYGCALLYAATRLAWGLWRTGVMQRQAQRLSLTGDTRQRWERYGRILGVQTAEIATSPRTAGPVTVGLLRGIMLVPPGFLTNVDDDDLDAVMAHELAHMRRYDFAKNLIYGFVTLPVAYHPAVWLTRSRVAATREMVCDAVAAEAVAGREKYARSLLRLASLVAAGAPEKTLYAIGIFDANIFERRVMKLTEKHVEMKGVRRIAVAVACVVLGAGTCASALALRMTPMIATAAAVRDTVTPRKVGGSVSAPKLIHSVDPKYTDAARKAKTSGVVLMNFWVGVDGTTSHVRVVRGIGNGLDEKAIEAVKQYRFKPATENGEPVPVTLNTEVDFQIF